MKIYLIPGLGFDDRVFHKLELDNIDYEYLNWIEPKRNETIRSYAQRLSESIDENLGKIILAGHSLGGIIAQEIAAIQPVDKIILISSIKSRKELPLHFKIVKPLNIHKLFSKKLSIKTIKLWGKTHDYVTSEEQNLFKDMVNKQSNHYLQWALKQLSIWDKPKKDFSADIYQIHGESDKIFPIKLIEQPNRVIKDARHFMVYKHSNLISKIIAEELKTASNN